MASTVTRRVGGGVVVWLVGLGAFAAVAHPEACPTATVDQVHGAVADGVRWIHRNQDASGRFLYRYDADAGVELPGYSIVRHAGTLVALEQARRLAVPGAREAADRGLGWAIARLTPLDGDRATLTGDTGATALLVAALVERRRIDGDPANDELLGRLGRFLAGTVTDEGAVVARWDLDGDAPIDGTRSPFFTGEVLWALAQLHTELPAGGWDDVARRLSRYLSTERDDTERTFPPVSDHWASYAFAEMATWPDAGLTAADLAYARRQAGLFGLQARFESQRRPAGIVRWTRGPVALPAGIGTVGEGLGGIWRLGDAGHDLGVDRATVRERLACVVGMLVARQSHADDVRVDGAWFRLGTTQVDDQQHAISALIAALPALTTTAEEQRS